MREFADNTDEPKTEGVTVAVGPLQGNDGQLSLISQHVGMKILSESNKRIEREVDDDRQLASNASNWWEVKATRD